MVVLGGIGNNGIIKGCLGVRALHGVCVWVIVSIIGFYWVTLYCDIVAWHGGKGPGLVCDWEEGHGVFREVGV